MKPKPPCSPNCEGRSSICHSICEPWKEYEKNRNLFYKETLERKEKAKMTYPARTEKRR